MWVMTTKGFYSAIQFDPRKGTAEDEVLAKVGQATDILQVRCRAREDADVLAGFVGRPECVQETNGDYQFRVNVTREEWATFLIEASAGVTYGNFKNEVTKQQGKKRHDVYMKVWSALLALQPRAPWGGGGYRGRRATQPTLPKAAPVYPSDWMWDDDPRGEVLEEQCTVCGSLITTEQYDEAEGMCEPCGDDRFSWHDLTDEQFAKMMAEEEA